jgi:hypothetical protein
MPNGVMMYLQPYMMLITSVNMILLFDPCGGSGAFRPPLRTEKRVLLGPHARSSDPAASAKMVGEAKEINTAAAANLFILKYCSSQHAL